VRFGEEGTRLRRFDLDGYDGNGGVPNTNTMQKENKRNIWPKGEGKMTMGCENR
jgi:hypothetical protein